MSSATDPKVSVVIPTYNRRELLCRCLVAATHQDYADYEVIVVDDGSTDGTDAMVAQDFPQVHYLRQANRGPAAARNRGTDMASGTIVAFTDDDCEPPRDWLRQLVAMFKQYPGVVAVGGVVEAPASVRQHNLLARYEYALTHRWYGVGDRPVLGRPAPGATSNLAVYRTHIQHVAGFDETYPVAAGEDTDLLYRLAAQGYATVNVPIRVAHNGSYTWSGFWRQQVHRGVGSVVFQYRWGGSISQPRELLRLLLMPGIIIRDTYRLREIEMVLPLLVSRYAQSVGRWQALRKVSKEVCG